MKRLIVFLFFTIFSIVSYGQFSFGLKGGIQVNSLPYKNVPAGVSFETKSNVGFHLGVFSSINFTDKFSLRPELQYINKGASFPSNNSRLNFNYLDAPVLVSYSPSRILSIDFGPTLSYRISKVGVSNGSRNKMANNLGNKHDFGPTLGVRISISQKISIISRYYYGLIPADEIDWRDGEHILKAYNRNIQLSISYTLVSTK